MPLQGTLIEGKYEVLAKIREGGMGTIYKVRHRHLDVIRVIKVMRSQGEIDSSLTQRFTQEAKTLTRLKHPHIGAVLDFSFDADGTAYIVLEFIDGVNLAELLKRSGPPGIALTLEIIHQTLLALGYLHRRNIIHRDIAPDNIMLTVDEHNLPDVKLIDLGIAKALDNTVDLTSNGVFVGKMKYSSREQLGGLGEGEKLDGRSDLYSLGVVLYELLTGTTPFKGDMPRDIFAGHLFLPPTPFSTSDPEGRVPQEVRELVLKALEKRREDRFASAEEFDEEIVTAKSRFAKPEDPEVTRPIQLTKAWRESAARSAEPVTPGAQQLVDQKFLREATSTPRPTPVPPEIPTVITERAADATQAEAPRIADAEIPTPRRRRAPLIILGAGALAIIATLLLFRPSSKPGKPTPPLAPAPAPVLREPPAPIPKTAAAREQQKTAPEAPTSSDLGIRAGAEQARADASSARLAAQQAAAPKLAPQSYDRARRKETEGQDLFERKDYAAARSAFAAATQLFQKAESSSTRVQSAVSPVSESATRRRPARGPEAVAPAAVPAPAKPAETPPDLKPAEARPEPSPPPPTAEAVLQKPVTLREVGLSYPQLDTLPPGPDEIVIRVEAIVTESGDVRDVRIPNLQHLVLDRPALYAIGHWRFRPATLNGKPVAVRIVVTSVVHRIRGLTGNLLKEVSRSVVMTGLATSP